MNFTCGPDGGGGVAGTNLKKLSSLEFFLIFLNLIIFFWAFGWVGWRGMFLVGDVEDVVLVEPMARGGGTLGWSGGGGLGGGLAESVVLGTGDLLGGGGGGWAEDVAEGRGSSGEFSNILSVS